jgi:hypothetical protein
MDKGWGTGRIRGKEFAMGGSSHGAKEVQALFGE